MYVLYIDPVADDVPATGCPTPWARTRPRCSHAYGSWTYTENRAGHHGRQGTSGDTLHSRNREREGGRGRDSDRERVCICTCVQPLGSFPSCLMPPSRSHVNKTCMHTCSPGGRRRWSRSHRWAHSACGSARSSRGSPHTCPGSPRYSGAPRTGTRRSEAYFDVWAPSTLQPSRYVSMST